MKIAEKILQNAKLQRKSRNPWEARLWYYLRNSRMSGFKFRRQMPLGQYIADFYCHTKRLIIELDGGQHTESHQRIVDEVKEEYFRKEGFKVLRFGNNELDQNIEGVLETIRSFLI